MLGKSCIMYSVMAYNFHQKGALGALSIFVIFFNLSTYSSYKYYMI